MNGEPDHQISFVRELLADQATIAGDVVEVGISTWAIHGSIPVDGEVLLAEYDTLDDAKHALGQLALPDDNTAAHRAPRLGPPK